MTDFYNDGMRQVQDEFGSRKLADRLEEITRHPVLNQGDIDAISSARMVFLATASKDGLPDSSYKGGTPGFVRIIDDRTIAIANYDGNGQFRSLGNLVENPNVGLLFIDFAKPWRVRVNGSAVVVLPSTNPELVSSFVGANAVIVVTVRDVFPNCGRYVHEQSGDISTYAPAEGHQPPEPEWKKIPIFADVLPGGGTGNGE